MASVAFRLDLAQAVCSGCIDDISGVKGKPQCNIAQITSGVRVCSAPKQNRIQSVCRRASAGTTSIYVSSVALLITSGRSVRRTARGSWRSSASCQTTKCSSSKGSEGAPEAASARAPPEDWDWRRAAVVGAGAALYAAAQAAPAVALDALEEACAEELGGADPNAVILVACIVQALALTGAFVGGILARRRKTEMERINAQLRQINVNLRRQARVESYAPALSYAPVGTAPLPPPPSAPTRPRPAPPATVAATAPPADSDASADPAVDSHHEEVVQRLKAGKRYLRQANPKAAAAEFEAALVLARQAGDSVEEKKSARGLGASLQRQGKYKEAIKYHQMVLARSLTSGEQSGNTDAYGAIADCYTELGDMENAAKFYDKYIDRLEQGDEGAD